MTDLNSKSEVRALSAQMEAALKAMAKAAGMNISISCAGGTLSGGEVTLKFKIKSTDESGKTLPNGMLKTYANMYGLSLEQVGSRKLVDYNPRAHKTPFIYEMSGKRYRCDARTASAYFAA